MTPRPTQEVLAPAEIVRQAAARKRATKKSGMRKPEPPAEMVPEVSPEEAKQAGELLEGLVNQIAELRGYPKLTEEQTAAAAKPAALVARKWFPMLDARPELALAVALSPYLMMVARVEGERLGKVLRERSQPGDRRPYDRAGADRAREDGPAPGDGGHELTPGLS